MDVLQKIGGRKFIMAILAIGSGMYLEISGHGLSVNMVGLLIGLVGAFSAANYMATAKHFDFKGSGSDDTATQSVKDLQAKIDSLMEVTSKANEHENVKKLIDLLQGLNTSIQQVQLVAGQVGSTMLNVAKDVKAVKQAVGQPENFKF